MSRLRRRKQEEKDGHYVVEEIVNDALVGGIQMYEVKWEGYSEEHNQWLAASSLSCPELLAKYHKAQTVNTADVSAFYTLLRNAHDCPPIVVTNCVDAEGAPSDFEFINNSIYSEDVPRPCTPMLACTCTDGCEAACSCVSDRYYDKQGRVQVEPRTVLMECGPQCGCDKQCWTRVVQGGTSVKYEIRRFALKGWGVVARTRVARGTFMAEYVGELITFEEAEERGAADSARGLTYLFDLDMASSGDVADFTVDAKRRGNISHFFNHSCAPNMDLHPVYIEHRDPRLHRLAFFAARDIEPGEELTFDYNPSVESAGARFKCACGEPTCRTFIFM
ncbi:hypothetical protein LPJ77_001648 [Coemansia sp. RSA 2523]|nr:hypothetical protein LPJ54_002677 [Coemansia sp. RSA 1824]KAJ1809424.1 hypothetical protein LPJ77_001648 [Coemansia sp. RSA 2523]KAJ2146547.1 hypothetical protein IW142_002061 [Coemansia sp. RSA 564]KAJ2179704.1 hypothetical protein EV181_005814 [Coemansia sp. RSA 532]KAJ2197191.1 hypothetical protein IW145_005718 [Coemansia sp. RSA 521]KAJ2268897.1 hypothetical protein EV176_004799 [Coemansia sp. RSA 451]KAJ2284812.1 hypothetical protein IW141_006045 [Coemansia sp. RSA 355]KAJ2425862.1 h